VVYHTEGQMRSFPSGCLAVIAVLLALLSGTGGGCLVGRTLVPLHRTESQEIAWVINSTLLGAAMGLVGGLFLAFVLVRKRTDSSDEDDR
jgi:hypothetical protein